MSNLDQLIQKLEEVESNLTVRANYKRSLQNELKQDYFKEEDIATKYLTKKGLFFMGSIVSSLLTLIFAFASPYTLFATLPITAGCLYQTFKNLSKGNTALKNCSNFKKRGNKYQREINDLEKEKEKIQTQIKTLKKYKNGEIDLNSVKHILEQLDDKDLLKVTDIKIENNTITTTKKPKIDTSSQEEELTVNGDQIEVVKE